MALSDTENDSDCFITSFKQGEKNELDADECQIIDYPLPKRHKLDLSYIKIPVNGDGFCIARCFSMYFNEPLDKVLDKLHTEFNENITFYESYSNKHGNAILKEVYSYVTDKNYNSDTGDLFLTAFSRIFNTKVVVFYDEGMNNIVIGENFETNVIELLKCRDHFDLLIRTEDERKDFFVQQEPSQQIVAPKTDNIDLSKEQTSFNVSGDIDFNYENTSADILFQIIFFDFSKYLVTDPIKGVRGNTIYTIEQTKFQNVCADDNGAYLNSRSTKKMYFVNFKEVQKTLTSHIVHKKNDQYHYNQRNGSHSYDRISVAEDDIYILERYYRQCKSINGLSRVAVRVKKLTTMTYEKYCCVLYSRSEGKLDNQDQEIQPHGNCIKSYTRPYIRTSFDTLRAEEKILSANPTNISLAYDTVLNKSGGPFNSCSQSLEPRDKKQLYNRLYKLKSNNDSAAKNVLSSDSKDDILQMLQEQKSNNMIESIIVKENAYYFFMCSSRQIIDIINFCVLSNEVEVLGIDTTFNLCDLWITDSCYKNKRIINRTSLSHPIFLGPLLFHFTKDESTFMRFALEMAAINSKILQIKKIGTDMDDAIFNGMKTIFPNVELLYCVRHLSQRDEKKLDTLLSKLNCSAAEKKKAKTDILKDVYGERKGTLYEFGLAESQNKNDFMLRLSSLKERWESRCPGFFDWFLKFRKEKFENSVISSAREGTSVAGLFYQNDIESIHFVEKRNQCFQKKSVIEVSKTLKQLMLRQEHDEVRAIYGAGNYVLSEPFSKFKVDSARWHSWDETRRREHVERFRSYNPSPSDHFHKPKNAGRKPGHIKRLRNKEPNVIVDRIFDENQDSCSQAEQISTDTQDASISIEDNECVNDLRFSDPRIETPKQFELYFRKDLPRMIRKCQGMCGKTIKLGEDCFLVKSYGKSTWTDKSGVEKSKFGPMYIHFNEKCLERFDSENEYGAAKRFDFKRIQVNESTEKQLKKVERDFLSELGCTFHMK